MIALSTSTAAAQSDGIAFDRELRAHMKSALDSTLARLQESHAGEKAVSDSRATATRQETRQSFVLPRLTIAPNREIEVYLTRYRQRDRAQIIRGFSRFAGYQPQIVASFASEGVPQEIALLGLVESGFDPLAVSPRQARGIWQFVPETGRRYGLRIGLGVDERTDPQKSTRAAARYLADLYKMFGNWPLALAAYNTGEARVLSAVARAGTRDFWKLSRLGLLPAETRAYVPAVLAAILYVHGGASQFSESTILGDDSGRPTRRGRIFFATLSATRAAGETD